MGHLLSPSILSLAYSFPLLPLLFLPILPLQQWVFGKPKHSGRWVARFHRAIVSSIFDFSDSRAGTCLASIVQVFPQSVIMPFQPTLGQDYCFLAETRSSSHVLSLKGNGKISAGNTFCKLINTILWWKDAAVRMGKSIACRFRSMIGQLTLFCDGDRSWTLGALARTHCHDCNPGRRWTTPQRHSLLRRGRRQTGPTRSMLHAKHSCPILC